MVIIVGILAGIGIPMYLSMRHRGWQAQLTSDVRNAILDVEAGAVSNGGVYPADQTEFVNLGPDISAPDISLSYSVNSVRTEFCVQGIDTRLPPAAQVAHYISGQGGVEVLVVCPAFIVP